ncbi:MAG: polysaccharide biosynthesis/export family protein, partial [Planctomycetes bacterium]|nr:polysaccharide biosynthesis/export family protein [Planctomycetota bacterium]
MWRGQDLLRLRSAGRGRQGWRAALAVGAGLLCGCADSRITVSQLQEREESLAKVEPLPVRAADLALSEVRPYTVGPGDILQVTMQGLADATAPTVIKTRVYSGGQIELPLVGSVMVVGKTLQQVDEEIVKAHVPAYVKHLAVFTELVNPETTTIMVTGAAGKPGLVTLPSNQRNVLYALATAGGFGGTSSTKVKVQPIRPEEEVLTYDLANVNDVRRAMTARPLESGDIVSVEGAATSVVYVTGLVNAPGPVAVPPDSSVSVMHAIYAAGGLRDWLEPVEATLVRTLPDGTRAFVKLDLADILSGKQLDTSLRAGDILTVPHTADTRVREWAINNLRLGPFSVGVAYDPLAQYNVHRALNEN